MVQSELYVLAIVSGTLLLAVAVFAYVSVRRIRRNLEDRERDAKHRLYEIAILKEIAERTGYSLNIEKILDVITGSLNQLLEYSAVSYMILKPSKIVFRVDLERSVSSQFIKDIRTRMISSLSALLARDMTSVAVDESVTGSIMLEDINEPVQSSFNIPLVIGGQLVGVLTVAHTIAGLYKEKEVEILYKIVNQASQAMTKLEDVIRTEQGKAAAMLESMIEGVIMTDPEYRIVAANPAAREIIGYKKNITPTIFDFIDAFQGTLDIQGKLEVAMKLDKTLTVPDIAFGGKYYQVLVSPVKANTENIKGQILGAAIIFHDITPEKEAEKMRNDFTSMMVHELRSPLSNIKKIGELMRTSKILESKQTTDEYASMLYDSSSSMLSLVNDLLDVAKLETGKFDIDKQPVRIAAILQEQIKLFDTTVHNATIDLKLFIAPGVPDEVKADSKRISQVLTNFLSNAIHYTPKAGTVTTLCFMHKAGASITDEATALNVPWFGDNMAPNAPELPDSVVIAVTDSGKGIAAENFEKLFNKFSQFSTSSRQTNHDGTGLGLVIVKGIVEAHGGVVGLGSTVGKGSTFYFTLPL
jgi:signal transduction histidine kinase